MPDRERLRRLRMQLYNMVEGDLGDAWVSDDDDQCETLDELEDYARTQLWSAQRATQKFRSFLSIVARERKKEQAP